jgi:exopolysaccharide biosynthesis polyprenyl glycosylphosphotransferase
MFSRHRRLLRLICVALDIGVTAVALVCAHLIRSRFIPLVLPSRSALYPFRDYVAFVAAGVVVFPLLAAMIRAADLRRVSVRQAFSEALSVTLVGTLVSAAFLYIVKAEYVSRSFVIVFAFCECASLIAGRLWLWPGSQHLWPNAHRERHFFIAGTGSRAIELSERLLEDATSGNKVVGFVATAADDARTQLHGLPVYSAEAACEVLRNHIVDEVHFAVSSDELAKLETFVLRCEEEGVQIRLCLDFLPHSVSRVYLEYLQEIPLLTMSSAPDNDIALITKRIADVVISVAMVAVLSPLLLLIALLVKLTTPGPVLYAQTRCGLGGRPFTLYKFRSMVVGAEAMLDDLAAHSEVDGPVFKMSNDPRCTSIGRWLRKWSFDELPQLWNVLRGDMSLVGPRPPIPEEVAQYATWHRRRLRMRPGLTCLWAVEGRNALKFERWVQLDIEYIERWSLWLDIKILLRSIPVVLSGRGAY